MNMSFCLNELKDLCVVTVYTCLKIYLYKKHCLFLSTMEHSFACFIMWLSVEYVANTWICVYMIVK